MSKPAVEMTRVQESEQPILENLYPLFIHDQWAYSETFPNAYGVIASARNVAGGEARSLAEQSEMLEPYWRESETHHPFLLRIHGRPAGFCLVHSAPVAPEERDFYLDELFLLHPYRRQGVGTQGVGELWRTRPGSWCLDVKERNRPAHAFWSKVIAEAGGASIEEVTLDGDYGPFIRFRFDV